MGYKKQKFVDNETVLTAAHLEHIEQGIIDLDWTSQQFPDAECRAAFVNMMNNKAEDLGMYNTIYQDPWGGYNNLSTAYDMCKCLYNAVGYEKMCSIWSSKGKDVRLLAEDNTEHFFNTYNKVTNRADGVKLYARYNVLGGKSGTHNPGTNTTGKYNMMAVVQSTKNPDDFYAIVTMNENQDTRCDAILKTMDIIESGEFDNNELDEIAYEGMSYRQIFIDCNKMPLIHENSMRTSKGSIYENHSTNPVQIIYSDSESLKSTPFYIKISSSSSSYLKASKNTKTTNTYYSACYAKLTRYTKGDLGVSIGSTKEATINKVTTDFQLASGLSEVSGEHGFFVGGINSANLEGLINSPVIIDTKIFNTVPSKETLDELYQEFVRRSGNIWEKMETAGEAIPSLRVCAIKVPKINPRNNKSFKVYPYFAKNAYTQSHPASMTKTMTMMVIMDYISDFNKKVKLSQTDIEYAGIWYSSNEITVNDSLTMDDLMYMIMLQSSNVCTCIGSRMVGEQILRNKTL